MRNTMIAICVAVLGAALARPAVPIEASRGAVWARTPEVPFVPTPPEVVDAMIQTADVTAADVVYDLGCGDGRIVIAAAKKGARAVGVDIDPQRIAEAEHNASVAGVTDKVKFITGDLFTVDLSEASVVTLYLLPSVNERLKPKLLRELKTGARVVSHAFDMGGWKADSQQDVAGRRVYFWRITDEARKANAQTAAETPAAR